MCDALDDSSHDGLSFREAILASPRSPHLDVADAAGDVALSSTVMSPSAGSARPRSELWSKGGASSASMKGLNTLPHQDASKSGELRNALVASEHELSETDTCLPPQPVQPSKRPGCCMIS